MPPPAGRSRDTIREFRHSYHTIRRSRYRSLLSNPGSPSSDVPLGYRPEGTYMAGYRARGFVPRPIFLASEER